MIILDSVSQEKYLAVDFQVALHVARECASAPFGDCVKKLPVLQEEAGVMWEIYTNRRPKRGSSIVSVITYDNSTLKCCLLVVVIAVFCRWMKM